MNRVSDLSIGLGVLKQLKIKNNLKGESIMKKFFVVMLSLLFLCGCESLRFAATEAQKENAWVHCRTAQLAADGAKQEDVSKTLERLTLLSASQSQAFVADTGIPAVLPVAYTAEDVLTEANFELAGVAAADASKRPDAWELADSAMELGIAVAGLLGGVYGVRFASHLKEARDKSKALKEIVENNEFLKQTSGEVATAFKKAQSRQSTETKRIVVGIKG